MSRNAQGVRADIAQAVSALADRVTRALAGDGETDVVAAFVAAADEPVAALGAVRVLGSDALAPAALAGAAPREADAAVMADAVRSFPLRRAGEDPASAQVLAWHDWAAAELIVRSERPARHAPQPASEVPRPQPEATAEWAEDAEPPVPGAELRWQDFAVAMAQLSSLALPGLDSPVHQAARRYPVPLARGACWAAMRRDHTMAARLGRWLAFLRADPAPLPVPLEPAPFLDHVLLVGGVESRTVLDALIGRRLLEGAR